MYSKLFVFIVMTGIITNVKCARILAITPVPSLSHQLFFQSIWKSLAEKGHEIVVITPSPSKETRNLNIRQIDINFVYEIRHTKYNITNIAQENQHRYSKVYSQFLQAYNDIADQIFAYPEVRKLFNEDNHFDVVVVENHIPIMGIFAIHFNCPLIFLSSTDLLNHMHETLGNPVHPVLYPDIILPYDGYQTFFQRLDSFFYWFSIKWVRKMHESDNQIILNKHFGVNTPSEQDILNKVDLVLVNTHPVLRLRPHLPGIIPIGGATLPPLKKLPKEIEQFLNNSKEGAIYFSLGTNILSPYVNSNMIQIFIEVFNELPFNVLWKFDRYLPDLPKNVKIVKWTSQPDVLRYENVKLFISQCGVHSIEESLLSHIPILGLPFVNDQIQNAEKIQNKKLGLRINLKSLSKESLKSAILEIIKNPMYKENVKNIAHLIHDEPMTGLEKAVWWTEYVIRNKGAKHFWMTGKKLYNFYEYFLLDILGFILFVLCLFLYLQYFFLKLFLHYFVKKFFSNSNNKAKLD